MAFDNIHVEQGAMVTATNRASEVNTSILEYEKKLSGIAEMVKAAWGGRAKEEFDKQHNAIVKDLGLNAADAASISDGTRVANQVSIEGDDASAAVIAAIGGQAV